MKKELKNRMREDISGFRLPRYEQIPDVGLYLEQSILSLRRWGRWN